MPKEDEMKTPLIIRLDDEVCRQSDKFDMLQQDDRYHVLNIVISYMHSDLESKLKSAEKVVEEDKVHYLLEACKTAQKWFRELTEERAFCDYGLGVDCERLLVLAQKIVDNAINKAEERDL
jgi:hypothetical protein